MFSKNTIFIVGAGASQEVGLPVGSELKGIIADKVDLSYEYGRQLASGDQEISKALKEMLLREGAKNIDMKLSPHAAAGRHIASAMPQALSIDNFLHTHSANEPTVLMGKLGIASSILQAEHDSSIYLAGAEIGNELDFRSISDSITRFARWPMRMC